MFFAVRFISCIPLVAAVQLFAHVYFIEITSWLVSAYDFYSRVVKNRKRTSERRHGEGILKSLCGMSMDFRKTASLSIIHGMSE